jgi:hypothetical protein
MEQADATPDDGSSSPWPLAGAALLVGVFVGAVWFAINTPLERRVAAPAAPVVAEVGEPPSVPALQGDIAELLKVEPAAEPAPIEVAADQALVCGKVLPRVALAEDRIAQTLQDVGAGQALVQFAQQQLTDDDHARAVGLVLRMHADAHYREGGAAACQSDDCWKQQAQAHAERVAPLLTELATLAATTTDARALTLAREQCGLLTHDTAPLPHCQALTARRLVALDRDNAAAWLALALEEPGAIDEAMHQATLARQWNDHATAARRFIERVDANGGLRSMVLVQSLLMTPPAQPISAQQLVLQHCGAKSVVADANRRQQCEQLAQGLRTHSHSLIGLATAALVAQALGRDDAEAWREDARLLAHVQQVRSSDESAQSADARDCSVALPRELLLRSAREGEVPALRAWMQASGADEAQWRERLAAADAAEAAAQASKKLASAAALAASAPR